ncbi:MAG: DUF4249 family protein [Paludibacter sp.]|nr:DUF4249 family protein [Paludibacter sp.]
MKKISVIITAILLFSNCGLELTKVDVDLEKDFIPQVAITTFLTPDSVVNLKLVMTSAAFSVKKTNPTFKSATIESLSDNQTYILSQSIQKSYIQLHSEELKPIAGGIYKMRIETQNPIAVLESVDTIPIKTPILTAEILAVEKSSNQLGRITFKPNKNINRTNYYEIVIFERLTTNKTTVNKFQQISITSNDQIITREDYYPSLLLIGAYEPHSLLFRLASPTEVVSIGFIYRAASAFGNAEGRYTFDHETKIELRPVSYAYFRYKTSFYKQINAANGDLLYGMAAPVTVTSNIKGGLGIFAGYCKSDTTISVAGRTGLKE